MTDSTRIESAEQLELVRTYLDGDTIGEFVCEVEFACGVELACILGFRSYTRVCITSVGVTVVVSIPVVVPEPERVGAVVVAG